MNAMTRDPAAGLATLRLCDATPPLLDAIGALQLAIRGLDDDADRRSLAFLADRVGEMAAAVDGMVLSLHHGDRDTGEADPNPDAELHQMINRYRLLSDLHGAADADSEEVRQQHALLDRIAECPANTVRGALAKLRLGFDDDELNSMAETGRLDGVGAASVRDVLRLLDGEA